MRKIILVFLGVFIFTNNLYAITLSEALFEAYKNNPVLNAERENLSISEEDLKISKSEFLPLVTFSGSKSDEDTKKLTNRSGTNATINDVNPKTQTFLVEQKIFQGFGGMAELKKNKLGLKLADAKLLKVEQEILYEAAQAYTGLVLANKKFDINKSNVNLLERQFETNQAQLEKGQISLADLAQSESSLAGAKAKFIEAQNEVVTSKLIYKNVIGPITNSIDLDKKLNFDFKLPNSLEKANQISQKNDPELIIAKLELEQSQKDVQIAQSELAPSATISFESSRTDDLSSSYDERDKEILKASVTWPIFSGGKNYYSVMRLLRIIQMLQVHGLIINPLKVC